MTELDSALSMTWNRKFPPGMKQVALQITPETSALVAELRAAYMADGRDLTSLSGVIRDAVLLHHSQYFSVRPRPSDTADYFSTGAHHD